MIIGITGTDGAGKGEVVKYLSQVRGFTHYSARALFIEELEKRSMKSSRASMREVANELRREHGNDFVIATYMERARTEGVQHAIIESLRAVAEAEALKNAGGILLAVDAKQALRYRRIKARASESDDVSFEDFKKHEMLEMHDPDPHGMQKARVIDMADYTIMNNGTVKELHQQIERVLVEIS